ncbi:hypothetical protein ACHAWF_011757 [Thalassiosira exigua]
MRAVRVTILLLLIETVGSFLSKGCGGCTTGRPSIRRSRGFFSPPTTTTTARTDDDDDASWEESLRQEATTALLPVLFPNSGGLASGTTGDPTRKGPIAAETALKRILRRKYQPRRWESDRPQRGNGTRSSNASRGRLAALILGTSVMRLRHWHAVSSRLDRGGELPMPHPLNSSLLGGGVGTPIACDERSVVRAMVDEHASAPALDISPMRYPFSDDPSLALSIRYSLPPFLATSLVSQYGILETEEICSLMNKPGPITLRRNAIQFLGTVEELCKCLWNEDGIRAEPLSTLLGSPNCTQPLRANDEITMTASADGRYVCRSISNSGSVMPPQGAIRIVIPRDDATKPVEQRRGNKSIWSMQGWRRGYFEVQDTGSQLIVQSLDIKCGDSILDYCAGNGGKTYAIAGIIADAAKTNNDTIPSRIVAHDVVEERLRQLLGSLSRVGFVPREDGDGSYECSRRGCNCTIEVATSSELDMIRKSTPFFGFDVVLVDVPCSSTGVLRRRPSQRWDLTKPQIEALPDLQLDILRRAASYVKEHGKLVYATCSLLKCENEDVASNFEKSIEYSKGDFQPWGFNPTNTNVDLWGSNVNSFDRSASHTMTILPSEGSDGFFLARWRRRMKTE